MQRGSVSALPLFLVNLIPEKSIDFQVLSARFTLGKLVNLGNTNFKNKSKKIPKYS